MERIIAKYSNMPDDKLGAILVDIADIWHKHFGYIDMQDCYYDDEYDELYKQYATQNFKEIDKIFYNKMHYGIVEYLQHHRLTVESLKKILL